jgi:hypothetical protein
MRAAFAVQEKERTTKRGKLGPYRIKPPRLGPYHPWEERPPQHSGWIYAAQEDQTPLVKIGCTTEAPLRRLDGLRLQFRVPLTLIAAVLVRPWPFRIERYVHQLLKAEHIEGEWFYGYMTQQRLEDLAAQAIARLEGQRTP